MESIKSYPAYKDSGVEWLGEVPAHWEVVQLGRIGKFSKGVGGTKEDEQAVGIPCIRYGDIYTSHKYHIEYSRAHISQERASDYTPMQYGDILFAGSGETIEEIGKSAVNLLAGEAYCGGDVILLSLGIEANARFMGYAADCFYSAYQKSCMGRGITVMHIYSSYLKYMRLILPPLAEQAAIAEYLDHADRHIRRYIDAKKKLIGLLEEQRRAIVQQAVTRGLDPDVSLKDSGVGWLGDVPEHWNVQRMKHVFCRIVGGATPSSSEARYWDGNVVWVTPSDISKANRLSKSLRNITTEGLRSCSAELVPIGSIIVTSRAPVGNVALAETELCTNQGCKALVVDHRYMNSRFGFSVLETLKEEMQSFATGTTFTEISTSSLGALRIPVPSLSEQHAIVEYLDKATASIDVAIARTGRQIELMEEYRTRLISDVVTGKLDVREAAAQLPEQLGHPEKAESGQ